MKKVKPHMVIAEPHGDPGVYVVLRRCKSKLSQAKFWDCLVICSGKSTPLDDDEEVEGNVIAIREEWILEQSEDL